MSNIDALARKALQDRVSPVKEMRTSGAITGRRRICFLVYPSIEIVDLAGPLDAFSYADWGLYLQGRASEMGYEIGVMAAKPGPVKTQCSLEIIATHGLAGRVDDIDTLIVVGGIGVEQACADESIVGWLRETAPRVRRVASVCTGAFLLAAAGLLNGRHATTHWMFCEHLAAAYPSLTVDRDLIFVRDGNVYTSGGITSGIDLALALIEEDIGREMSLFVARMMVVFLRRPGGQTQFSAFLEGEAKSRHDIRELQAWLVANPSSNLTVEALADRMAMSPRNFARLFRSETGMTPAKYVEHARVEAARCKLEQTALLMETIAKSCGFGTSERMRRSFLRVLGVGPQDYRMRFRSTLIN